MNVFAIVRVLIVGEGMKYTREIMGYNKLKYNIFKIGRVWLKKIKEPKRKLLKFEGGTLWQTWW